MTSENMAKLKTMNTVDKTYAGLLKHILGYGDRITTRNADTFSCFDIPAISFLKFPLVTVRRTAWKKAIREMEWFMSGYSKCPDEVLSWWEKQLNKSGEYRCGYPDQYRSYNFAYDQIKELLIGIKAHPTSRRLALTAWNPDDMAHITEYNDNPNTPTTCHTTFVQFFVRQGKLHMKHYQRSADMLLGLPHNWVQHWALLLYLAYWTGLEVGGMIWVFGDAHIYDDESHTDAAWQIISHANTFGHEVSLEYRPTVDWVETIPKFKASDFHVVGDIPEPLVTVKPKLFE